MSYCVRCKRPLKADDIGIYRKMIERTAEEYLCMGCLANDFGCEESLLQEKADNFRKIGCLLFPPKESN